MTTYIALLRGINVGGKNKIKMVDLKRVLEAIGLSRVQTYIQSGNVLFEADEAEAPLRQRIEERIAADFGMQVVVVLRTLAELERIAAGCPFSAEDIAEAEAASDAESLYVALLPEAPAPEKVERLGTYSTPDDRFQLAGRDIYLLFRFSVRDSKLAAQMPKLGVPATVRNWNTIRKLLELAQARG